MIPEPPPDDLLTRARHAAARPHVREAVRDLSLRALRGYALTPHHLTTVAKTVGEGIESAASARSLPEAQARSDAWRGLEDALLRAIEVLAACASPPEGAATGRDMLAGRRLVREIGLLESALSVRWGREGRLPPVLAARLAALRALAAQGLPMPENPGDNAELALARRAAQALERAGS